MEELGHPGAGIGGILLYLDEIQYFNKKQQQTLLEHIENGRITLIASTTENPYFYVYSAILSRSTVFEFKSVEPADVEKAVERGFAFLAAEQGAAVLPEPGVVSHIARSCGGDVRKALNAVELCVLATPPDGEGTRRVTPDIAGQLAQRSAMRYDKDGDEHYDIISAYQKSMRGSDPDAALHYLARLLEAGDLPSACRRLMVCACEDVGLAYPQIIPIVKAAVDAALQVGLPEARCLWLTRSSWWRRRPNPTPLTTRSTRPLPMCAPAKAGRCRAACKTSITMGRTPPSRGSITGIPIPFRTVGWSSSICLTHWWAPPIMSRPKTRTNRRLRRTGTR